MKKTVTETLESNILNENNFDHFLEENNEDLSTLSLAEYLEDLLEVYHVTKKEIIDRTLISLVYGYQIFSGVKKKPARDYLLQFALAFPLTIPETKRLLYYGGANSLYPRIKRDAYIMFALNRKYPLAAVNEYLFKNQLEPFREIE